MASTITPIELFHEIAEGRVSEVLDVRNIDEFEARARNGEMSPFAWVCIPTLTGDSFVQARELRSVERQPEAQSPTHGVSDVGRSPAGRARRTAAAARRAATSSSAATERCSRQKPGPEPGNGGRPDGRRGIRRRRAGRSQQRRAGRAWP